MSTKIEGGNSTAGLANVTADYRLEVQLEPTVEGNENQIAAIKNFSENDAGSITGTAVLASPETDLDFRLRTALDNLFDFERFNYTAQNTGKYTYSNTTMTAAWSASGLTTNSGTITTTTTGLTIGTYAEFPFLGTQTFYCEFEGSFSTTPVTNSTIDIGMFRRGAATAYDPLDGIYFRLSAAGLIGVINNNSSETSTATLDFTIVPNQKYQFIISINQQVIEFWIDNILYGSILVPVGQGSPCASRTLPFSLRQAFTGAASGAIQFNLNSYNLSIGGAPLNRTFPDLNNGSLGSYQGLSGGTMGSLTAYTNNTNPTAAVPSNTALTANLVNGLGGVAYETFTGGVGVNVDAILLSYQVPSGSVSVQGKRLKVTSIKLSGFIQTVLTGGGMVNLFTLAFGSTAVSSVTSETQNTKAPRIVVLPEFLQNVTSAQAANTLVNQSHEMSTFDQPIYVNPGEFIQIRVKHLGTAPTAGVIAYVMQLVYSWE